MKRITIIFSMLCLLTIGAFAQHGSIYSQQNTSFLTSAKRTTIAVDGYITAGVFPVQANSTNTASASPDFVIEHIAASGGIMFSNYYNLQTDGISCGMNTTNPPSGPFGWYKVKSNIATHSKTEPRAIT